MRQAHLDVRNWDGTITSHPMKVVKPKCARDITSIVTDQRRFPSPVRAVGSNGSTTRCGTADGGTLLDMSAMNRVIAVGNDKILVQAGARLKDVAEELLERGLEFYGNPALGNRTVGSAVCGGTWMRPCLVKAGSSLRTCAG